MDRKEAQKERAKERALVLRARRCVFASIKGSAVTRSASSSICAASVSRRVTMH